jgi:hypothetical protein
MLFRVRLALFLLYIIYIKRKQLPCSIKTAIAAECLGFGKHGVKKCTLFFTADSRCRWPRARAGLHEFHGRLCRHVGGWLGLLRRRAAAVNLHDFGPAIVG